ncbi:TlpA family protein disulfide reductase [Marinobacterium jannaschii]|uniref:TlpA family protein disulfide reductase n=1 Tax=Marinobacterium jannaschii TaxID=64970 RepID=UPI000482E783|nr:TlpA disulfide reductase family protein [Marinobacterium jannaschii]
MRRWQRWGLELIVVIALFIAIDQWRSRDLLESGDRVGPERLVTLDQQVAELVPPGQPVLVYFFAPWCSVCKLSIGNLQSLQKDNPELEIRLVALDYSSRAEVLAFIDGQKLSFPVLMGDAGLAKRWHIKAYPTYYLIGDDSRIVSRNMGYSSELGLRARLEML